MNMTALKIVTTGGLVISWMALSAFSPAAKKIELGLQTTGTAAWEIAAMQAAHLDEHHGIDIEVRDVANSGAGQVALQAGEVDVILSDFVWTSIQRHEGADFTFVPHSLAVGGLMVMPDGPVQSLEDLDGASIAVAGGPVDKSFVALQAYYAAKTGGTLSEVIEAEFGAPPLVNELLLSGGVDAALNFWHFNARATVDGAVELISVAEMLKELGVERTPPLLGWVSRNGGPIHMMMRSLASSMLHSRPNSCCLKTTKSGTPSVLPWARRSQTRHSLRYATVIVAAS